MPGGAPRRGQQARPAVGPAGAAAGAHRLPCVPLHAACAALPLSRCHARQTPCRGGWVGGLVGCRVMQRVGPLARRCSACGVCTAAVRGAGYSCLHHSSSKYCIVKQFDTFVQKHELVQRCCHPCPAPLRALLAAAHHVAKWMHVPWGALRLMTASTRTLVSVNYLPTFVPATSLCSPPPPHDMPAPPPPPRSTCHASHPPNPTHHVA